MNNAQLADKAFAASRRKYYGNNVKALVGRALEEAKDAYAICSKPSSEVTDASKAIADLATQLKGRVQAFEAVHDAMHGNKAMLRHYGSK